MGMVHVAHAVAPGMVLRKQGTMVFVGSVAGQIGSQTDPPYSAAKAGLINFAMCAAKDLAPYNVRVNTLCPGPTDTALFASFAGPKLREALTKAIPFRRLGQPADVANVVAFLASDEASFVTGQTVSVSGGLTMS